jgi:uncharacterized membrane protein YoaK (UPF0700 family)
MSPSPSTPYRGIGMPDPSKRKPWSDLVSDPKHGPLPALLLTLTVVTGLVDAVSILSLGRVFVANMTGNVVFIGFALAGAPGFSLSASLFALGGFLVGAFAGGLVIGRARSNRGSLLLNAVVLELILLAVSVVVAQTGAVPYSSPIRDTIAALTAIAMGIQNATARRLAVPDLTTTVLTMTLTGLAADIRDRNQAAVTRRLLAVLTMLGGAILGAILIDHVRPSAALEVAAGLIALVTFATMRATRLEATWQSA